jgi:hypothetical protein
MLPYFVGGLVILIAFLLCWSLIRSPRPAREPNIAVDIQGNMGSDPPLTVDMLNEDPAFVKAKIEEAWLKANNMPADSDTEGLLKMEKTSETVEL